MFSRSYFYFCHMDYLDIYYIYSCHGDESRSLSYFSQQKERDTQFDLIFLQV